MTSLLLLLRAKPGYNREMKVEPDIVQADQTFVFLVNIRAAMGDTQASFSQSVRHRLHNKYSNRCVICLLALVPGVLNATICLMLLQGVQTRLAWLKNLVSCRAIFKEMQPKMGLCCVLHAA